MSHVLLQYMGGAVLTTARKTRVLQCHTAIGLHDHQLKEHPVPTHTAGYMMYACFFLIVLVQFLWANGLNNSLVQLLSIYMLGVMSFSVSDESSGELISFSVLQLNTSIAKKTTMSLTPVICNLNPYQHFHLTKVATPY